jgi:ABC-type lipoprotein release transport system permease subunit
MLTLATSRVMAAMLFGIGTADLQTYTGVLLTAIPLVILAAVVPALRAARLEPTIALRQP